MTPRMLPKLVTMTALFSNLAAAADEAEDPFLWLESIDGTRAMEWVEAHNQATIRELALHPDFEAIRARCLEILDSEERIAYPSIRGTMIYNFWQGAGAERGVWRRSRQAAYLSGEPRWETVLDIDALARAEQEQWVFKGAQMLDPEYELCLVQLSRGGSDAVEVREFDLVGKSFSTNGFFLPESKTRVAWLDRDTLLVGTDFGADSMTDSGYPRIVKRWRRGTPIEEAETLFEGRKTDVGAGATVYRNPERTYVMLDRSITFYQSEYFAYESGRLVRLDLPADAAVAGIFKGQVLVELKSDWAVDGRTLPSGALVAAGYAPLMEGRHDLCVLHAPERRSSLAGIATTLNQVLATVYVNGQYDRLQRFLFDGQEWRVEPVSLPGTGTVSIVATDDYSDRYFFAYESPLTPRSLYHVADDGGRSLVKSLPAYFDAAGFAVEFHEATSKDGVRIPYSVVIARDAKRDGSNPTLLYGYGGFEVSLRPHYSPTMGSAWLERGGVYAMAHIRGGGEFGPAWHQAAKKENRQRAFDDFIAVSEDLVARGICSRRTLGIMGGSNGGLLVGVAATQRPDLYGAVVCAVPLLDMKRFNKLLAGASWMGEYGNPDLPEEWAYLSKYSPYHQVAGERSYPRIFFTTTTRDDRVHPGHARKMAARMESMGHPVFYYENTEGGHGSGVTNGQRAYVQGLTYAYLLTTLRQDVPRPETQDADAPLVHPGDSNPME